MDYLKTVIPSQFVAERGANLVVINPGSANIKVGIGTQDAPLIIPHCIARRTAGPRKNVIDQALNSQVTTAQHLEREKAYDAIASFLKIPSLNEEVTNSYSRKMARLDGSNLSTSKSEPAMNWTDVIEMKHESSSATEASTNKDIIPPSSDFHKDAELKEISAVDEDKYREFICGEEALRISPCEPYCLRRPLRRGHFNVSPYYPAQQVLEDLHAIWEWILSDKLHIPLSQRTLYSAILVVPETFDSRELKELLSIVLGNLHFGVAVIYQEALATIFGNGLSTACVVNIGAQATSVICVEDGVVLPTTGVTLPFGGEDISRCLLWTQRHHQTWPPIRTDAVAKPIDLLMLNRLKEFYCQIKADFLELRFEEIEARKRAEIVRKTELKARRDELRAKKLRAKKAQEAAAWETMSHDTMAYETPIDIPATNAEDRSHDAGKDVWTFFGLDDILPGLDDILPGGIWSA